MLKLKPVTPTKENINLLVTWRRKVHKLWKDDFYATFDSTKKWLSTRKIYFVVDDGVKVGQIGYDLGRDGFYIGYLIRGRGKRNGAMTVAVFRLIVFGVAAYGRVFLEVLPSNTNSIEFYKRIGFKIVGKSVKYLKMKYENPC